MQCVEHFLAVGLESRREKLVQVRLIIKVDSRDRNGATVAGFAGARGSALLFISAVGVHGCGDLGLSLSF